jgi:acyl-CoA dehydrogenase|tara:strand:+ start:6584 stop:7732 length:1149 start_codon:yes stop_codon:yes gene_type:complete
MERTIFETEHNLIRDAVRSFATEHISPFYEQWEEDGQVDRDMWRKAGEAGLLSPNVPAEFGGMEADFRVNAVIGEELSAMGFISQAVGFSIHSDITVPYIMNYGTQEQKEKYLPACITGDIVLALAMSEPAAGSDLQGIKTTAVKDGNDYILNGSKVFITNGQHADLVLVVAKTDPTAGAKGISLFLVEADSVGFSRGQNLKKIGLHSQDTSELFFDNVRVPVENLLGSEGMGFIMLMSELPTERMSVSVGAIASAQSILQQTIAYTSERKAFGKPIAGFQNTQFKLAEMDTDITVAQVFVDRCLELLVEGKLDDVTAAKVKLMTSELQCKVIDECLQLHGGYGYMMEYPVARAFLDSRVQRIYAGTSEIMKVIISRNLFLK